ncbi:MAG TPA: hypothetical protein VHB77_07225, partial [Planctomycetaceae bacterium]|nr:hypothetical protein [Planctomycetaceae bacterium]
KAAEAAKIVMFSPGKYEGDKSYMIILREEQRQYLPPDFLKTFQVVLLNSPQELQKHFESVA